MGKCDKRHARRNLPNPDEAHKAADEIVRLRAVLDSIDALHWRKTEFPECGNDEWCGGCGWPWPCPDHLLLHPAPEEANDE